MAEKKKTEKAPAGTVKKVLRLIRKYIPLIGLSLFFAAVNVALALFIPLLFGEAIDLAAGAGAVDFESMGKEFLRIGILTAVCALASWGMALLNNKVSYRVIRDLRDSVYDKINRLPLSYLDARPTGDTVNRMISDADQLADGLLMGFSQFFTGILTILGTLIFMLRISVPVTLVVALLTPVSLFAARFIANHTYRYFREQSTAEARQTAMINEVTANLKTVKAFGKEQDLSESFGEGNEALRKTSLSAVFFSSLTNPVTRFVNAVVYAAVAFTGAAAILSGKGTMTVGLLACVLSYANRYTKPFNEISGVAAELQHALACAARVFEFTEAAEEQPLEEEHELTEVRGDIECSSVCFSYDKSEKLIENFDLSVKKGQKIAIVGPTGCGKTTLINLLMRFYDTDSGTITVDGTDVKKIKRGSLRASYGMVLQDTWLMPGTVRENIAFGCPDADDERIIEAAKRTRAWSFIKRLPDGLDTVIGEDGGALSEGQKQLLCVTRVMLSLPSMLILDEATSSIDTRTEVMIQKAFDEMMTGRTSFIVAHRLSTVTGADRILVMDKGRIIEQGTHEELLAKNGFYADLLNKMTGG